MAYKLGFIQHKSKKCFMSRSVQADSKIEHHNHLGSFLLGNLFFKINYEFYSEFFDKD